MLPIKIAFILSLLSLSACGTSTSSGSGDTAATTKGLRLNTVADFSSSASASLAKTLGKTTTAQCSSLSLPITSDSPTLANGLDCDADNGIVAHVTPSTYKVALKKITLKGSGTTQNITLQADSTTLALSTVYTFTSTSTPSTVVTIDPSDLTAGTYTGVELEIYYIEMTFPVAGVTRNVRIYLSDDNFTAEGSLGHHQGDITFIDDTGTELGWVDSTWTAAGLTTTRGTGQNGAGGTDAETGHARGFFGNTDLWNATTFQQGATQDIYVTTISFDSSLTIPDISTIADLTTVTLTFSTADTFYYEDFAPQDTADFPGFYPDTGGEATSANAEWAPLAPTAAVAYATSS
jgi:hypothetical protein